MEYDLNIVNGKPNAADHNPFEYHFSFDKQVSTLTFKTECF